MLLTDMPDLKFSFRKYHFELNKPKVNWMEYLYPGGSSRKTRIIYSKDV